MLKLVNSDSTESCINCTKNSNLIKKYEELLHLYKKKQMRSSQDLWDRNQRWGCTSQILDYPSLSVPGQRLGEVLTNMFKSRCRTIFKQHLPKTIQKFVVLNLSNRIQKFAKIRAFQKIKVINKNCYLQIINVLNQKFLSIGKQAFGTIKAFCGSSTVSQLVSEVGISNWELQKKAVESILNGLTSATQKHNPLTWLQRRNAELEMINRKFAMENQILKRSLEELAKRQAKDNQKKKESLEMLAEEITEKNEQINNLRQTVKAYQQTYMPNGNILEDDIVSMRKQIDYLENIKERLNNDLDKVKYQLDEVNKNLRITTKKNQQLSKENIQVKKNSFDVDLQNRRADLKMKEFGKLIDIVNRKIKRLSGYERQLDGLLISNNSIREKQCFGVEQQLKSQMILMFLTNIQTIDYNLHAEHLFDEEEKTLLMQHKENWLKINNQSKCRDGEQCEKNIQNVMDCLEISEINVRGGNDFDSIFNALESPRESRGGGGGNGITMKLLQMELEKNALVEKISEVKEKLLHIRVIILKLLKSLEIQADTKPQAEGILRVIFDLFEYSEEERESIFMKKKKFFGFI